VAAPVAVFFHVGGGVSAPRVVFQVDPEFSEEARKAKYQGTCTLMLVVDSAGRPTNIRVANSLGMVWMRRRSKLRRNGALSRR